MYVDEVGNPDLGASDDPNHRFLSLSGVVLELAYVESVVHPELEALKRRYFASHPDEPVVLHRKDLINARGAFSVLRAREQRESFDRDLLALLEKWNYTVITVCLDKRHHCETYRVWRYDPYHYCLAVLMERFVLFLSRFNYRGDVLAESRGGREDHRLKKSFFGLWKNGTNYLGPSLFQAHLTSRELKIKTKSNNIAGLQLADLIAYPSRHEILLENGLTNRSYGPFTERVVNILQTKYDRDANRVFGKKLL